MRQSLQKNGFIWGLALLNLALAIYATPISDWGDPAEYILLSESFLGWSTDVNMAHRSPLYSIILAGFMLVLKPPLLYKVMVFLQYLLLAFTSWMIFLLFQRVFSAKKLALFTALLFNLSFATIFYGTLLQTEILTVFLVVLAVTILLNIYQKGNLKHYIALGAVVGLISLARFSAVPLIFTFFILLLIVLYRQKASARKWVFSLCAFFVPYLLLINAWCVYNQYNNGFYGLFPHSGQGVSKNIMVASLRPYYTVSEANKPILDLFLEARETYLEKPKTQFKGSLAKFDKFGILPDLYGGYAIYMEAGPELRQHFALPATAGEYELSQKLTDFYREISGQNQAFVLKFRFISFLNGFRAAESGTMPPEFGKINLNILPAFFFIIYRLAFVGICFFVFFSFFYFVLNGIKNGWNFDFTLLTLFFIVFSFWGINFVFVTAADANRFKFPAEPFIFGLFVYYSALVWNWFTGKVHSWRDRHRQITIR
ncbi:MAG: hypothetical protein DHS20C18_38190 [Saprospiraceae bacterium]|nr:MAG: hypothetical protein DHS20C18_38190 [Saprospiraceae bacterium]